MRRGRALLYAALALCVPLPAFALSSGQEAPPPVELALNATLDGCGLAEAEIVCRIDVAFDSLPGATRYTASVTRPDGSVIDQGTVGAGSTTLWVPYVGNGTYLVAVSAYGEAEEPGGEEEVLDRAEAEAEAAPEGKGEGKSEADAEADADAEESDSPAGEEQDEAEVDGEPPACSEEDEPEASRSALDAEAADAAAGGEGEDGAPEGEERLSESLDCPEGG